MTVGGTSVTVTVHAGQWAGHSQTPWPTRTWGRPGQGPKGCSTWKSTRQNQNSVLTVPWQDHKPHRVHPQWPGWRSGFKLWLSCRRRTQKVQSTSLPISRRYITSTAGYSWFIPKFKFKFPSPLASEPECKFPLASESQRDAETLALFTGKLGPEPGPGRAGLRLRVRVTNRWQIFRLTFTGVLRNLKLDHDD